MSSKPIVFDECDTSIIKILADQKFHSSVSLAQSLAVNSGLITYRIKRLEKYGLKFGGVSGNGFKLLDKIQVLDRNCDFFKNPKNFKFEYFDVVDSTNDCLLYHKQKQDLMVAYAEYQTKAKGRNGKKFCCVYGQQLTFSIGVFFVDITQILGLSIAIGVAVLRSLKSLNLGLKIKWPNDIYANGEKICGILVDSVTTREGVWAVVGIGLNIAHNFLEGCNIKDGKKVTSIEDYLYKSNVGTKPFGKNYNGESFSIDKTEIFKKILTEVIDAILVFRKEGLSPFIADYDKNSLYYDQEVKLISPTTELIGINKGINSIGSILLETNKGIVEVPSGEMSLRPLES